MKGRYVFENLETECKTGELSPTLEVVFSGDAETNSAFVVDFKVASQCSSARITGRKNIQTLIKLLLDHLE